MTPLTGRRTVFPSRSVLLKITASLTCGLYLGTFSGDARSQTEQPASLMRRQIDHLQRRSTDFEARAAQLEMRARQLETRARQLETRATQLETRATQLERLHEVVVCGHVDYDRIKSGLLSFRMGCDPRGELPSSTLADRLQAKLSRPGLFAFEFVPQRRQKPIVLATASNRWGSIPKEASSLRVSGVSERGFTVETFDTSGPTNPASVSFFFIVLGEPPPAGAN